MVLVPSCSCCSSLGCGCQITWQCLMFEMKSFHFDPMTWSISTTITLVLVGIDQAAIATHLSVDTMSITPQVIESDAMAYQHQRVSSW